MIGQTIPQEDAPVLSVYTLNIRASKCMWQKWIELKGEIGKAVLIITDFNTSLYSTVTEQEIDHHIVTQLPNGLLGSLWPPLQSISREEPEITPRCTSKSCHSLPTAFLFLGQRRNSWLTSSYPAFPPRPPCISSLPPRSHASPSHTSPLKALPALLFSQEHTAVSLQSFHPSDLTASITPFRVQIMEARILFQCDKLPSKQRFS